VLTDNGSCFTPAFAKACAELDAEYRHTRPYSPHTNGMVERFNGRVSGEVLGITIPFHQDLEQVLRGFNAAYNARRQSVLGGKTLDQVVAERFKARRKFANLRPHGRAGPGDIAKAHHVAEAAKDFSQPDSLAVGRLHRPGVAVDQAVVVVVAGRRGADRAATQGRGVVGPSGDPGRAGPGHGRLARPAVAVDVKRHPEPSRGRHRKPGHPGHPDAPAGAGAVLLDLSNPDRRFSRRR
jgi:hypothetical protein